MKPQDRSSNWIFLILGIGAVTAATYGISRLNAWSDQTTRYEQKLYLLQSAANRLDALEWRAIAKRGVDSELESAIGEQRQQATLILNPLQGTPMSSEELKKVTSAYQKYSTAVDKLLDLLAANKMKEALEVDETEVDPSYETLYQIIEQDTKVASQAASHLTRTANIGSILITLSLVATVGLLFQQYLRTDRQLHDIVVDSMKQREANLEQEREILESKVQERTQEFQEANTKLVEALTDLKQSQVQVIQGEKMSMLGQLVSGVAHEINNPVGFLGGNISHALDYVKDLFGLIKLYQQKYPQPDADIQDEIESIDLAYIQEDLPNLIASMREGVNRIRDISTGLRTFSRADSLSPVPFNLHDGIDSTLMILKHRLKANENRPAIEIVKQYGELPSIECYAGQLNQVFMNLLANAIDALDDSNKGLSFGEIKDNPNQILIATELGCDHQSVVLRIKDNGMGMTEAIQQKIFDHLFTTKGVGKGTGLGLAIAHPIVTEKHGGTLSVNSSPGQGAEFVITIPVRSHKVMDLELSANAA